MLDGVPKARPPASCPATYGGGAGRVARGWGRAFGACCCAGKLRSPAGLGPDPPWPGRLDPSVNPSVNPYVNLYVNLYARGVRTPRRLDGGITAGRAPEGG